MRRRIVPVVLLAACIGGFVASGLHSVRGGEPAPASVSRPVSRTTYYVDATIGGNGSDGKCISEGTTPRVKTVPCRLTGVRTPLTGRKP